jgi:hypothetical protein
MFSSFRCWFLLVDGLLIVREEGHRLTLPHLTIVHMSKAAYDIVQEVMVCESVVWWRRSTSEAMRWGDEVMEL